MSFTLLVAVGAILLVSVGLLALAYWFEEKARKDDVERFDHAQPAKAKIIEIGTSIFGKTDSRVSAALRFEVFPQSGEIYKARSSWLIEPDHIKQIRVGECFEVKIDAKKQNIIFPDVAWAHYDWERQYEIEPIYDD